jgi:ketosteroid isomerase-like protein
MAVLTTSPPPRIACLALPRLLSAGDLERAAACFARDACLLTPDATAIHERRHIRPVLAQLIARRVRIEVKQSNVLMAGEVAFIREHWSVIANGAAGSHFAQDYNPTMVLRRVEDSWKISIAAPWGWSGDPAAGY